MLGHQENYFCSLNMINTGIPQGGSLEFISVGKAKEFTCKIDNGPMQPCKLIFDMTTIILYRNCVKSVSVLCEGANSMYLLFFLHKVETL